MSAIRLGMVLLGFSCAWAALAQPVSECTTIGVCYCVNGAIKSALDKNISVLRKLVADERALGKAVGYVSVPLSNAGGGYFGVNKQVAAATKTHILKRFGMKSVWILDPGDPEADVPIGNRNMIDLAPLNASGADYMYMWTKVLEGASGYGEDFDFFYFVGPTDFSRYLKLDGRGDMAKISAYFKALKARDASFAQAVSEGKITEANFRNYYALRASASFSNGAHDEWNIARTLNERRRSAKQYGAPGQLPIFFDGHALPPGDYEAVVSPGYAGKCGQ